MEVEDLVGGGGRGGGDTQAGKVSVTRVVTKVDR